MRVLVTGHDGYIGTVMVPMLLERGHEVVGLDSFLFEGCALGADRAEVPAIRKDIRDVTVRDMDGIDAVFHLAAISNDPLGDLNPQVTYDINHLATAHLGEVAKEAGVKRFVYSSSCSLYGAQGDAPVDESAAFNPVTPYGESKLLSEESLSKLADDDFSPTYLRNATAYGVSPRLRGDLVVNNLTGFAYTTGKVFLKSDGRAWRPLVHIADISKAFIAVLEAPQEKIHNEPFNVGATKENYLVRDVAEIVNDVVPDSVVTFSDTASADLRNYRVDCDKIVDVLGYQADWTVRAGVEELYAAFQEHQLTLEQLEGSRFMRIKHVRGHLESGSLNDELRWTNR